MAPRFLSGSARLCASDPRPRAAPFWTLPPPQFPDGGAYRQYQPLTKKGNMDIGSGFNDDPLWLIAAVYAYLGETGDYSILDESVDFDNDHSLHSRFLSICAAALATCAPTRVRMVCR